MSRTDSWVAAVCVGAGTVIVAGVGVYTFITATTPTLHPSAQNMPSVTHAAPVAKWASAVERGRQVARAGIVEKNLPGLSVAVGAGTDIVWAEGFGWADVENRVRVTPSMRFRIGHASKALTSAGVALLMDRDRLHLGEEIQTYVPAFPRKPWPVTLRQLMGHMAGVRHYNDKEEYMPTAHCERASEGLESFANDPLRFEPETQSQYSTFGWVLVSAAVEAAADEPFFTFMREEIFQPLGMSDTTSDSATEPISDRVTFYYPRLSGDPSSGPELAETVDYSCLAGAGGFVSTPSDLVRYGIALRSGTLLQPATVKVLQTPQLLASGQETAHGLGWMVETVTLAGEPTRVASHASLTLLGSSTSFMTFPERALVVAVMSNISRANTTAIARNIAEAFAARP